MSFYRSNHNSSQKIKQNYVPIYKNYINIKFNAVKNEIQSIFKKYVTDQKLT